MNIVAWIVASTLAYWLAALVVPTDFLREVFYITSVAVMFMVAATWGKASYSIIRANDTSGPALLILSVFLVGVVVLESRAIAIANYYLDRPSWLYHSPLLGFVAFQITAVGYMQLRAVAKVDTQLPSRYERNLWIAGLIGAFIGGVMLQPFIIDLIR